MSGCLYFVRYWAICVLQLFVNQVVKSWILKLSLYFWSSSFFNMTKKSRQKLKYLENKKNCSDEIKSIFHHFERAFNKVSTTNFLEVKVRLLKYICKELKRYNKYKTLQVVYNNHMATCDNLLALDNKLKAHQRHLQFLAIEI